MVLRSPAGVCVLFASLAIGATELHAETAPVSRPEPGSGVVVSRASGEVVRFAAEADFRDLVVGQDLLGGDLVRTGPLGALSLVFIDRTVMRLHPNTELLVKSVSAEGARLGLSTGLVWARTPRAGGGGIVVDTPSASAGIRGTDWSLAVEPGAVTRLSVFDGAAELSNPLGSVLVGAGAQAIAEPGRAPFLVQVANLREREQMLFAVSAADARSAIARVAGERATPAPPQAEAQYREGLTRFDAGAFAEAAAALEAATPALDPERAAAARWTAAFARAAAGEAMAPPADGGTATDILGRAYLAAYSGDLEGAGQALAAAGDAPFALNAGVQVALYRDRPEEAAELLRRLQAVAPGSVEALSAEAEVEAIDRGDPQAAVALLRRAVALRPGDDELWQDLSLAEDAADHPLEAEAAARRAVELAPGDPATLGNLAILLLDQYRHDEARALIDRLLAADPGSYLGLRAAARLAVQEGREDQALQLGLRAVAAQPAAAETSLGLAIAAYQAGNRVRAEQELDAAARLDPNDPLVPVVRTVIALDDARADDALRSAREAERLYRLNLAPTRRLAADRASGSYLVEAYSNLGLDEWARDVADRTYDPLSAASLFSEALAPRPTISGTAEPEDPVVGASLIQGLLLEPLGVSARLRDTDLLRRPFLDAELGGRWLVGDDDGFGLDATMQGFVVDPTPVSFAFAASGQEVDAARPNDDADARSVVALLGAQPTARFGAFGFLAASRLADELPGRVSDPTPTDDREVDGASGGLGFTLRLEEREVLSGFASFAFADERSDAERLLSPPFEFVSLDIQQRRLADLQFVGLGYLADDPDGTTFAGVEAARIGQRDRALTDITAFGVTERVELREEDASFGARAYLDRRFQLGGPLEAEAELGLGLGAVEGGGTLPLSPRLGIGARLAPGHRVRAAAMHETNIGGTTLGPVTTLGLVPIAAPILPGGETAAAIFRYDGEVTDRLHLSLEHQSVLYDDIFIDDRDLVGGITLDEAVLHRAELRADLWLGWGFGAFASVAAAQSEVRDGPGQGFGIPTVPEREARFGLTWVHPAQLRASVEGRYVGERVGDLDGSELDPAWTADATLAWEPFDKRLLLAVEGRNLLDADVERAFDQGTGGRAVWLSGAVRF